MRSASTAPPHINSYKIPNHVALIDEIPAEGAHGLKHLLREKVVVDQFARRVTSGATRLLILAQAGKLEDGRAGGGVVASLTRVRKPDHVHDRRRARFRRRSPGEAATAAAPHAGLPLSLAGQTQSPGRRQREYPGENERRCRRAFHERRASRQMRVSRSCAQGVR